MDQDNGRKLFITTDGTRCLYIYSETNERWEPQSSCLFDGDKRFNAVTILSQDRPDPSVPHQSVDWDKDVPPEYIIPVDQDHKVHTTIFHIDKWVHRAGECIGVLHEWNNSRGCIYRRQESGLFKLTKSHKMPTLGTTLQSAYKDPEIQQIQVCSCGGSGWVAGMLGEMMVPCECRS